MIFRNYFHKTRSCLWACATTWFCVFVQISEVPALVRRENLRIKEFLMAEIYIYIGSRIRVYILEIK